MPSSSLESISGVAGFAFLKGGSGRTAFEGRTSWGAAADTGSPSAIRSPPAAMKATVSRRTASISLPLVGIAMCRRPSRGPRSSPLEARIASVVLLAFRCRATMPSAETCLWTQPKGADVWLACGLRALKGLRAYLRGEVPDDAYWCRALEVGTVSSEPGVDEPSQCGFGVGGGELDSGASSRADPAVHHVGDIVQIAVAEGETCPDFQPAVHRSSRRPDATQPRGHARRRPVRLGQRPGYGDPHRESIGECLTRENASGSSGGSG